MGSKILWPLVILSDGTFCFPTTATFRRDIYEKHVFNIYPFFLSLQDTSFIQVHFLQRKKEPWRPSPVL